MSLPRVNFHTHTIWCDGKDTPRQMVEAAIAKGFTAFGFSSHAMIPESLALGTLKPETIGAYFAEVRALAREYQGKLRILCGVEADYVPETVIPDRRVYAAWKPDYIIGSIHFVVAPDGARVPVDHTPELLARGIDEHFGGSAEAFVSAYFAAERKMVSLYDFDVVGHPDLIRKFNAKHPYFDETASWYRAQLRETAWAIARSGKMVEVNTGAISRLWLTDAYPSKAFRKLLRDQGVPFILSADAHAAEAIDCAFDRFGEAEKFQREPPMRSARRKRFVLGALLLTCFAGASLLPLLHFDASQVNVTENRTQEEWPTCAYAKDNGLSAWTKQFEASFNDRFFGRNALIRLRGAVATFFDGSGNEKVQVGRNGWLYYQKSLEQFSNAHPYPKHVLKEYGDYFAKVDAWCKAHGKLFLVFFAADKCRVYPEGVKFYRQKYPDTQSRLERLIDFLRANYAYPVVSARQPLVRARANKVSKGFLFYKHDSHWTSEGAYYGGYLPIMEALDKAHMAIPRVKHEAWKECAGGVDLERMLPPGTCMPDATVYFAPVFKDMLEKKLIGEVDGKGSMTVTHSATGQKKLFVWRDSMAIGMMPWLSRSFAEVKYRWRYDSTAEDEADLLAADVVMFEIGERVSASLVRVAKYPAPFLEGK